MDATRGRQAAAAVGIVAVLLAGCGATEPDEAAVPAESAAGGYGGGQQSGSEEVVLVISDFSYDVPANVSPGATITVRNEDDVGHTVTSDEAGVFDVMAPPGESVSFTVPDAPGEYPFHCTPHPQMTATLAVG